VQTEPPRGARSMLTTLVLLSAAACTASQPPPKASFQPGIGDVPPDMQSDYESFAINCSKCHHADRALTAPVTDVEHWDIYVAKMMRTAGSAISADEKPHILRFLYWYTGRKLGRAQTAESAPGGSSPVQTAPRDDRETQGESTP
jgi:hypothetical protein